MMRALYLRSGTAFAAIGLAFALCTAPFLAGAQTPALGEEMADPGEAALIDLISAQTVARLEGQYPAGATVHRDAHPKTHGLVRAQFIVLDGLPSDLKVGLFATPHVYDALIRFSAGGLSIEPDTVNQARGMAVKLLGVAGEKLIESEADALTHDFVMINYPTFFVRNLEDYEAFHVAEAVNTKAEFFATRPAELAAVKGMTTTPFNSPAQVRYWSQVPYKLGSLAIKFSAIPLSNVNNVAPPEPGPDYLREALVAQIAEGDIYFDFAVQVQTDPVAMPVEDPLTEWSENTSSFRRVALIRIPMQDISGPENLEVAEQLSFTPWHALPEHRPLGSINRTRRVVYETVSKFRHERNGMPRKEPTTLP